MAEKSKSDQPQEESKADKQAYAAEQKRAKKAAKAVSDYYSAQLAEKAAREKGTHGDDAVAVAEAKRDQAAALSEYDEVVAAKEEEEKVTLAAPNPHTNHTDVNGVEFKDGVASDVPRSIAEAYVADFIGYEIK